jgi:16S rRNA (cytosine967-C5)-methyltransferase
LSLAKLDPEVLTSLRMAAYQMIFLNRIPARSAIHESVELVKQSRKRSAVSFANAVLRKLAGDGKCNPTAEIAVSKTSSELAERSAHPEWLVERWVKHFGFGRAVKLCGYDQQIPKTTIRLNDPEQECRLSREGIQLAPGRILASARQVIAGDLRAGRTVVSGQVIIQDEASQLIALLLGQGSRILDCCAAPGGKTRVLAEQNPCATIVAVDLHPHRARLLRKLVPAENVRVIAADASALPVTAFFDRILVDAPCSGTGTLARNPEIKWRLKVKDLADLRSRQIAILQSAMLRLSAGGCLVYATCSLEAEENQAVMEEALSANSSFKLLNCGDRLQQLRSQGELVWNDLDSLTDGPYLRTIPGIHPCDGFFAALLERA